MNHIDRLPVLGLPLGFGQQFSIDMKRSRRKAVNLLFWSVPMKLPRVDFISLPQGTRLVRLPSLQSYAL